MGQNIIEKIAQKFAIGLESGQTVKSGDYVSIQPAYVMTHDNTGAVIPKFKAIGATKIAQPRQVVFTLDHNVQDTGEKNLQKYANIQIFAREMGVDFYPAGRGIGHQIMCEEGYAWPGIRFPFHYVRRAGLSGDTDRSHRRRRYLGHRPYLVAGPAGS